MAIYLFLTLLIESYKLIISYILLSILKFDMKGIGEVVKHIIILFFIVGGQCLE